MSKTIGMGFTFSKENEIKELKARIAELEKGKKDKAESGKQEKGKKDKAE